MATEEKKPEADSIKQPSSSSGSGGKVGVTGSGRTGGRLVEGFYKRCSAKARSTKSPTFGPDSVSTDQINSRSTTADSRAAQNKKDLENMPDVY